MSGSVTMRDVAQAVGMSPMTVSRALRGDNSVSPATRELVAQAAAKLGYVYDGTAQAFRTKKSGFVAVILPSINNANFAETFRGISVGLDGSGIQLLLGSTNYQVQKEYELVRQLLARKPEAIVLTGGYHLPQTRDLLQNARIPVIETWDIPETALGHVVGFSNEKAMGRVVRHLVEKGRRKIAFLGAQENADFRGRARREGAVAVARELGLPDIVPIEIGPAPVTMVHGSQIVLQLGSQLRQYDALMCVSDPVAFGVLSECKRAGIRAPEDIAITGFGHFDVAKISEPRITTVGVRAADIGQKVASVLRDIFDGKPQKQKIDVGSELVVGATS